MAIITVSATDPRHSRHEEYVEFIDSPSSGFYDSDDFPELFLDEEIAVENGGEDEMQATPKAAAD
ncbi:hypothetical protein [Paraherbaspirillum soli]|uniref:Uncharacterized protein n=1 Tax=Paraherbaspirillum soli TaxID=631222 RepID=A0ABW0MCM8_9BURK